MSTSAMTEFGGSSRQSLASARSSLDAALTGISAAAAQAMAGELFAVVATMDSSTALRRALTDSSREAGEKTALVKDLFGSKISPKTAELLAALAALRWSSPSELADALVSIAIETSASAANVAGELDRLEEELFTFEKLVTGNPELRQSLNASKYTSEAKQSLVTDLMGSHLSGSSAFLLRQLVAGLRGRNIESTISFYSHATAARRSRVIALVRSAVALTKTQRDSLEKILANKIGQPVRLNLEIDPLVMGGISIRFADELIDATIVNRLAEAGRALAG